MVVFALNKFSSEQDLDFSFSPILSDLLESLSGIKALGSPHPCQISALRGGPYLFAYRSNFFDSMKSSKKSFRVLMETLCSRQPSKFDPELPEDCLSLLVINCSRHSQRLMLKKSQCSISVLRKWTDTMSELIDLVRMVVWTDKSLHTRDSFKNYSLSCNINQIC